MTQGQPEALRLAEIYERGDTKYHIVAAELRRQHARITELEAELAALKAAPAAQAVEPEAIAEITSASHDQAEFGERGLRLLTGFQHLEYGTKLYALAAPQAQDVQDAVRYRWLRDFHAGDGGIKDSFPYIAAGEDCEDAWALAGTDADAAIDAAIAASAKGGAE